MIIKKYSVSIPDIQKLDEYRGELERFVSDIAKANGELIDQEVLIKVNPKAWWCPNWLYKKIIKDHISVMFFLTKKYE